MYPHNIIIAMAKQKQVVSKIHRSPQSPILIIRLILICTDRALDTEYDWILILLKAHHYDNVWRPQTRDTRLLASKYDPSAQWWPESAKIKAWKTLGYLVWLHIAPPAAPSHVSLPWYLAFDSSSIKICSKVHSLLPLCDGVMETLSLSVFSESSGHFTLKASEMFSKFAVLFLVQV